jgi:predicted metal-dependent phosphoesterase TrpH
MFHQPGSLTQPRLIKAEFHCHTCYSKDSLVRIKDLLATSLKKGLQRVVVTDHNTIQGALEAYALDPQRFIVGEEIMTQQGELLGIFVNEPIPAGLTSLETIQILRSQGAFTSVSHPFDGLREGHWELEDLLNIIPSIDAIEVFNSRCLLPQYNNNAKKFANEYNLLGTVGSDSHSTSELGTATLTLPDFDDPASLKNALAIAQPHLRFSGPWVHFYSRYAAWRKKTTATIH